MMMFTRDCTADTPDCACCPCERGCGNPQDGKRHQYNGSGPSNIPLGASAKVKCSDRRLRVVTAGGRRSSPG